MLFFLTGTIQSGKTRWLEQVACTLASRGVGCVGVLAPGVWVRDAGGSGGADLEKIGIDNVLLPERERIAFAQRSDLVVDGNVDRNSQSFRAGLGWAIRDEALSQVNRHFERNALRWSSASNQRLLIVDELGRLELVGEEGLTAAVAMLDAGASQGVPHAVVVVREALLPLARERFAPADWGGMVAISPDPAARIRILQLFC